MCEHLGNELFRVTAGHRVTTVMLRMLVSSLGAGAPLRLTVHLSESKWG